MRPLLFLLFFVSSFTLWAQGPSRATSSDIYFKLKRLAHLSNVLYIAAHPDDENTHLLTYFMHHEGVNATYYSLTRGDGGQNILGTELGKALGIIRTMEMYEARKLDKAHQRFGTAFDFGFSKTPEETFKFWNKDSLVQQTILLIQELKPDLVICRFPTTGEGGHGHHTASAIIAKEAYEKIKELNQLSENKDSLWLPKRLIFNAFNFRTASTIKEHQIKLKVNQYNPILGKTYSKIAGESRSVHHSQGVGTPELYGSLYEHFELMSGQEFSHSIWEGIDKSWNRIGQNKLQKEITQLLGKFDFTQPEKHFNEILALRTQVDNLSNSYWRTQKLEEIDDILFDLLSIRIQMNTPYPEYEEHQSVLVELKALHNSQHNISITSCEIEHVELLKAPISLTSNELIINELNIPPSISRTFSQPYWLSGEKLNSSFPILMKVSLSINDSLKISKELPLTHYYLDPIWGDKYQFTRIKPLGEVEIDANFILRDAEGSLQIPLWIEYPKHLSEIKLTLTSENKIVAEKDLKLSSDISYYLWDIPSDALTHFNEGTYSVILSWKDPKSEVLYTSFGAQKVIQYDHIPHMPYFKPAEISIINNDFNVTLSQVAYIDGVGDEIPAVLEQLGIKVDKILPDNIKTLEDLQKYEAIIIGIRAYNRVPQLNDIHGLLTHYVKEGGRVVVQYNTNHELIAEDIGLKPLVLSRDRVTEEDAPVRFIDNEHPILNYPHPLSAKDFDDWIQERGLYFPSSWDEAYTPLLEMSDTGAPKTQGALLVLDYGKGSYIYTGLSFFRQLPVGHKGALKLFLNMMEYPNKK